MGKFSIGFVYLTTLCFLISSSLATASPRYIIYYNSDASALAEVVKADYSHVILSFLGSRITHGGEIELI
ncbi:hypothetical protein [Kiloniella sp.]|uniref:hypothetical protein n=1 Tax=Kiloniella sp. TaxID=1938587 RepID=UPI003B011558